MPKKNSYAVYMKIYYRIIDDIINQKYTADTPLPTQNKLAEQFGVSRVTIREAIKELCRRGIVKTVKGKGTFVLIHPSILSGTNREKGLSAARGMNVDGRVQSKTIQISILPATDDLSGKLLVKKRSLLTFIERVRYVQGRPACLDNVYLVNSRINNINLFEEELDDGSLYEVLQKKADVTFDLVEDQFRAVSCPDKIAHLLEILPGEPVMNMIRISYDQYGRPVEYCNNYERNDIYYTKIHIKNETARSNLGGAKDKLLASIVGATIAQKDQKRTNADLVEQCQATLRQVEADMQCMQQDTSSVFRCYSRALVTALLPCEQEDTTGAQSDDWLLPLFSKTVFIAFNANGDIEILLQQVLSEIRGLESSNLLHKKEQEALCEFVSFLLKKQEERFNREEIIGKTLEAVQLFSSKGKDIAACLSSLVVHQAEFMPALYIANTVAQESSAPVFLGILMGILYGSSIIPAAYSDLELALKPQVDSIVTCP